jgi:hypothetical protein
MPPQLWNLVRDHCTAELVKIKDEVTGKDVKDPGGNMILRSVSHDEFHEPHRRVCQPCHLRRIMT